MPRYFFQLSNGETLRDDEGEELADDAAARDVAIEVFAETVPSRRDSLNDGGDFVVLVTDANDVEIYSITAQGRRAERP